MIESLKDDDHFATPLSPNLSQSRDEEEDISGNEWKTLSNQDSEPHYLMVLFKDEPVLVEGSHNHTIFRIVSGTCRVEKIVPDPQEGEPSVIILTKLGPGEIFGEIGFFTGKRSTCSIIAEEFVELQIITARRIQDLLSVDPKLSVKFLQSACASIAMRISQRESEGWSRFGRETQTSGGTANNSQLQAKRRDKANYLPAEFLVFEDGKETPYAAKMLNGKLVLTNSGSKQSITIDFLHYVPYLSETRIEFLSDLEEIICKPPEGYCDAWFDRLKQTALLCQSKHLCAQMNPKLLGQIEASFNKIIRKATVKVQYLPDEKCHTHHMVLRYEHCYFYDHENSRLPAIASQNFLFGVFKRIGGKSLHMISCDAVCFVEFLSEDERNGWMDDITKVKKALLAKNIV